MASSESDSAPSFLDQLINHRNQDLQDLFSSLPMIIGFSPPPTNSNSDSQESDSERAGGRIILLNPTTQGMLVIQTNRSLQDLFREFTEKEGRKPASKASIEAMPKIEVTEEDADKECVICLDGYEIGSEVKEMPCKHRYHGNCIEKWLGVHGSCPVCRYEMPLESENKVEGEEERGRRSGREEIWVRVSVSANRESESESAATEGGSSSDDEDEDVVTVQRGSS